MWRSSLRIGGEEIVVSLNTPTNVMLFFTLTRCHPQQSQLSKQKIYKDIKYLKKN